MYGHYLAGTINNLTHSPEYAIIGHERNLFCCNMQEDDRKGKTPTYEAKVW